MKVMIHKPGTIEKNIQHLTKKGKAAGGGAGPSPRLQYIEVPELCLHSSCTMPTACTEAQHRRLPPWMT